MGGEEREGKWEVKVTTKEGTRNENTRNRSVGWGWGGTRGHRPPHALMHNNITQICRLPLFLSQLLLSLLQTTHIPGLGGGGGK